MIFIDEASPGYAESSVPYNAGSFWEQDVQLFNSLINDNYDFDKIILFNVLSGSPLYPTNGSDMPIDNSHIVDTQRDANLTSNFIESKFDEIWTSIPTPTTSNPIRIVIYIDSSGSMSEKNIQPALDGFISSITNRGYSIKKQYCGTERYLNWIYTTAKGNPDC